MLGLYLAWGTSHNKGPNLAHVSIFYWVNVCGQCLPCLPGVNTLQIRPRYSKEFLVWWLDWALTWYASPLSSWRVPSLRYRIIRSIQLTPRSASMSKITWQFWSTSILGFGKNSTYIVLFRSESIAKARAARASARLLLVLGNFSMYANSNSLNNLCASLI